MLPFNDMPYTVCVCMIHENVRFLVDALNHLTGAPKSGREFVDACVCDRESLICMKINDIGCINCKSPSEFYGDQHTEKKFTWHVWKLVDGRSAKMKVIGKFSTAITALETQWRQYLNHCFYKDQQSKYFENCRENLDVNSCVVQVDFSENYQRAYQDEIQLAHSTYKQVTVFTSSVWTKDQQKFYCIISNYLQHDKYAVHTFMENMLVNIKELFPNISKVHVFSDGAA